MGWTELWLCQQTICCTIVDVDSVGTCVYLYCTFYQEPISAAKRPIRSGANGLLYMTINVAKVFSALPSIYIHVFMSRDLHSGLIIVVSFNSYALDIDIVWCLYFADLTSFTKTLSTPMTCICARCYALRHDSIDSEHFS